MNHLDRFEPRPTKALPWAESSGWTIKRYAIVSNDRKYDDDVAEAVTAEALRRLPAAGHIDVGAGNHGIGFQIVHFAQVAVVSPVFHWKWGSVLAKIDQMRAPWDDPRQFSDGVKDVVGCLWEMEVVAFEVAAWKACVLGDTAPSTEKRHRYLEQSMPSRST